MRLEMKILEDNDKINVEKRKQQKKDCTTLDRGTEVKLGKKVHSDICHMIVYFTRPWFQLLGNL